MTVWASVLTPVPKLWQSEMLPARGERTAAVHPMRPEQRAESVRRLRRRCRARRLRAQERCDTATFQQPFNHSTVQCAQRRALRRRGAAERRAVERGAAGARPAADARCTPR